MMSRTASHTAQSVSPYVAFARAVASAFASLLFLCALSGTVPAQDGGRNTTPPGLAPGAPAGSYSLTGFESINLYSGNLNFNLPLLKVGGRGHVGASVNLSIDSVKWDTIFAPKDSSDHALPQRPGGIDDTDYRAFDFEADHACVSVDNSPERCEISYVYNPSSAPALLPIQLPKSSDITGYAFFPMARSEWSSDSPGVGYGPGIVRGRYAAAWEHYLYPDPLHPLHSDPHYHIIQTLYRMTFVGPDGTEHELVDTFTGGRPVEHSFADTVQRGRVFVSTDGSAMTFLSDAALTDNAGEPTGYLFFPDGTRCRVEDGLIKWTRDADGNTVSYSYGTSSADEFSWRRVTEMRDTLGRRVTITYSDPYSAASTYDEIKFNGVGGTLNRSIKVWHSRMGGALRDDQILKTVGELFPGTSRPAYLTTQPQKYNPLVTSAVELPDGRKYQLRYNSYGELARAELPTGAAVEYDYTDTIFTGHSISRRVKERRSAPDGVNWEQRQTFTPDYVAGSQGDSISGWNTTVTVETHDVKGGGDLLVAREKHYFYGYPLLATAPELFYAPWSDGREYRTEQLDTSGTNPLVLRRQEMNWQPRQTPDWWYTFTHGIFQTTQANAPSVDPRVVTTTNAVEPYAGGANLLAKQTSLDPSDPTGNTVGFDQFNNRTDLWEYDFGPGGQAGQLLRHTHAAYVQTASVGGVSYDYACLAAASCGQSADAAGIIHIRGLAQAGEVRDAADIVVSRSEFVYDEPNRVGDDYGSLPTNFPGWAAPATPARGNLTTTRAWLDTLGGYQNAQSYLETHTQYDRFGNPLKNWDTLGAVSEVRFSADYKYALPTETVSADPDGAGPLVPLTTTTVYDFATGALTDIFDANNKHTHAEYEAGGLDRLKSVTRPDDGWTEYDYGDGVGNLYLHTRTLRESVPAEKVLEGYQFFDGMARAVRLTGRTGESTWAATATEYDGVGRSVKVSNPYEASDYVGAVPQGAQWTTTQYDSLGRAWSVTTPDGAKLITHFNGQRTLVTDQAGKQRLSTTDALGRLTEVWEVRTADAATGTAPVAFPQYQDVPNVSEGYRTGYTYDVLGNLRKVEQGAQRRYFAYDSLKRLLRARNPEQDTLAALQLPAEMVSPLSDNNNIWSVKYEYDGNSNIKRRTDARGISTDYDYDALNRVTYTNYSDSTPDVAYTFDGYADQNGFHLIANARGRVTQVRSVGGSGVSVNSNTAFDVMGRVTASSQTVDGVTYTIPEYKYDLTGNLTSETYPSGRVVETQYDAGGRVAGVKKLGGDYYAGGDPGVANNPNVIRYAAHDGVAALRLGNGLWERTEYNNRLQPEHIRLGTESAQGSVLQLDYGYSGASNNGNLMSQTITVPASATQAGLAVTQVYSYDALNRLESAREASGSSEIWKQTYAYDRYGNRTLNASQTTLPKLTAPGQTSSPAVANPSVQSATNRLNEDQDGDGTKEYSYDKSGNMTCEARYCGPSMTSPYYEYDAENRLTRAGPSAGGSSYTYDGDGRRVKKVVGAVVTVFVYDAAGKLVAEYGGAQPQPGGVSYFTQDDLGSTRVVTGQIQEVRARYDYFPFGEEISAGRPGYAGAGAKQRYTGKERDGETGLDYFLARYYSSGGGRFVSADPVFLKRERLSDPQRLNLFTYARNNPHLYVDPTGEDIHVKITNVTIDQTTIRSRTASEIRAARAENKKKGTNRPLYREQTVSVYRVDVTNDSGGSFSFNVTRDTLHDNADGTSNSPARGDYGANGEAPPGSYKGVWITSGTTGLSLRIYDADDKTKSKMSGPDGDRYAVQIHEGNCSEGCPLIRGSMSIQEVHDKMGALQEQDRKNGKGTEIYVDNENRNDPTDNFHVPETHSGTIIIIPASPPPARQDRRP